MSLGKKLTILTSLVILVIGNVCPTADARSVYVISNTGPYVDDTPVIQAYETQDVNLVLQTQYEAHHPLAISLAIDADNEFLFVTHEELGTIPPIPGNRIEIVNAKIMEYAGTVTAAGASNLAGIAYDQGKQKVYVVDRQTPNLFVYSWFPELPQLVLNEEVQLPGLIEGDVGGAWGLALDESNKRLWVTSNEQKVRFYDTDGWSHDPNTDFITVCHSAIGIAADEENGYIYTGTSQFLPKSNLLSQYDLSAEPNSAETTVDIGTNVMGIAVDQQTGVVYVTTYGSMDDHYYAYPRDRLFVFDSNLTEHWVSDDIGNPAGVAVAGDVSFRRPYLGLEKVQDVNACLLPGEAINYTISYDACGFGDSNVALTDYLPDEVDFNSASEGYSYDVFTHRVRWKLGQLDANESNSVTLSVIVNERADLNRAITNRCRIEGDTYCSRMAGVDANVCCWPVDIIYVDQVAIGFNTGISWVHAYTDLEHALNRARTCDANEIWVAEGTYIPTRVVANYPRFELADGVPLYGGFAGYETTRQQRNWLENETVLSGDTYRYGGPDAKYVVTASDINEGTIDGFVIEKSNSDNGAGFYCINAGVTIEHNRIMHGGYGLKLDPWSSGSACYNEIRDNAEAGVLYWQADEVLLANNWIHHNEGHGVDIVADWWGPLLRNNTIGDNGAYGVYYGYADVNNCIIWDNDEGSLDGYFEVTFSCVQGGHSGEGNIDSDPCFVADANDPNDYHLASDSPCIDRGDPDYTAGPNETDIDGEDRIIDGNDDDTATVDMGADEYYWSPADFDLDGFVNFIDYAIFAAAWQTSHGEGGYDPNCNLADENNTIDYNDLRVFCEDWLWRAGWTLGLPGGVILETRGAAGGGESMAAQGPAQQLEAEAYQAESQKPDVEELLKWLEEIWQDNEDVREAITEAEWEEFIEAVKSGVE